jgi:hypothetical protein
MIVNIALASASTQASVSTRSFFQTMFAKRAIVFPDNVSKMSARNFFFGGGQFSNFQASLNHRANACSCFF